MYDVPCMLLLWLTLTRNNSTLNARRRNDSESGTRSRKGT